MLCKRVVLDLLPNARAACELPRTLITPHNAFFMKSFSSRKCTVSDEQSFTVSYLMSSCGLTRETALRASQKLHLRSKNSHLQPDSVLTLLRNHGFTNTHISKLVRRSPEVLLCDPKKTLLPKLEFFLSMGIPNADVADIISFNPNLLKYSLKNRLIPFLNYLKRVMLLNDKQVLKTLKQLSWILGGNLDKHILPQVAVLREIGVTANNLSTLMTYYPHVLCRNYNQFDKTVAEVVELGLDPSKWAFFNALHMMLRTGKSSLEHKMEVYKKFGWSEDDFRLAFKKQPLCMGLSERKISRVMDFLVNKMGWKPIAIARVPTVLLYSLKKRIIPRCLVVKVLILKGLIEKDDVRISTAVILTDKCFLDKFVTKYAEDVPQLLDVFNGKAGLAELGFKSET